MKNNNKRDILFFLGAGFSREAGLPIMSEFGEGSHTELNDEKRDWSRPKLKHWRKNWRDLFTESGKIFEQFQKFCGRAKKFVKLDCDNMEVLFCIAESLAAVGETEITLLAEEKKPSPIKISKLLTQIKIWLWKIYHQFPPYNRKRATSVNERSYESLFDLIKKFDLTSRIYVLTTNYDLVFECFAIKSGIKCCYPFQLDSDNTIFETKKSIGTHESYLNLENSKDGPMICKLHGSVNYFRKKVEDHKYESKLYIEDQLIEIENEEKKINRPNILSVECGHELIKNKNFEPLIIPPTYAKIREEKYLRSIWAEAFKAIQNAKKLIFIGYSLPESDGFIRSVIQTAMTMRRIKGDLKIFAIDPCDETHERYRTFFNPLNKEVEVFKGGFKDACFDYLPKILSDI